MATRIHHARPRRPPPARLALAAALALALPAASTSSAATPRPPRPRGHALEIDLQAGAMAGFESNVELTAVNPRTSASLGAELGGSLLLARPHFDLRGDVSATFHTPATDPGLWELILDLPVVARWRLTRRVDVSAGAIFAMDRSRSSPSRAFFALPKSLRPFRYTGASGGVQANAAVRLTPWLRGSAGPYLRAKQLTFASDEDASGPRADILPDYRLFDLGGQVALAAVLLDQRLALRLRYDLARRLFTGRNADPPAGPVGGTLRRDPARPALAMTRHLVELRARAHVLRPLWLLASYGARITRDNGGHYSYLEHILTAGVTLSWRDILYLDATLTYRPRTYTERPPCDAFGPDCRRLAGAEDTPGALIRDEGSVFVDIRAEVAITDWVAAAVAYEMEEAWAAADPAALAAGVADVEDPLLPHHRLLGGAIFRWSL